MYVSSVNLFLCVYLECYSEPEISRGFYTFAISLCNVQTRSQRSGYFSIITVMDSTNGASHLFDNVHLTNLVTTHVLFMIY